MSKNLIHFAGDDYWNSNPHSRYHIAKTFWKKGYKVLWINQVGFRFPSLKESDFAGRILRKFKSYLKAFRKADDSFYVYTPIIIPIFKQGFIQNLNNHLLKIQLKVIETFLQFRDPVLFFSTPVYAHAINFYPNNKSFYYYSDKYSDSYVLKTQESKEYISNLDSYLYKKVDQIFCASTRICDYMKTKTDIPVSYLPHGVDVDFFLSAKKEEKIMPEIRNINKPIIGYYGTLTVHSDWKLIEYCIKQRPKYNFVFIGRKEADLTEIEKLPNVFFLGKKPYSEIPYFGKEFDVCLSFWVRSEWIKNSSPLKLKEYMALGKPIVSTVIEEIMQYADIIYISENKFEFLENIDKAVSNGNDDRTQRGLELVKNESWANAVNQIENALSVNDE